jgi:hypothetical protein
VTARGNEAGGDVIAGLEARDFGSDLDHHAGSLMPTDHREDLQAELLDGLLGHDQIAGDQVLVAVTETGGVVLDEDLPCFRRIKFDLFDLPLLSNAPKDGATRLHLCTS